MNKQPIIGFVRYSCRASFTRSDFFKPEYLDYRLNIFRNITLKSFQEQTNKDFIIFILHSENLPDKYKNIFKNLEDDYPFLYNIYIPDSESEGIDYVNAVESTSKYVDFYNDMSINFRIDNDDALHCDFINKLKGFLKQEFNGYIISFPDIYIIQRNKANNYLKQEKYFPSNSIGLAYVTTKNNYKTIMTLGDHGKVNQKKPMVLLPGGGGVQTINGKNIMNALYFGHVSSYDTDTLITFLKENGYSDFDFTCLNICKRRIIIDTIIKTKNFINKKIRTKT
jgi:hypothetical protein